MVKKILSKPSMISLFLLTTLFSTGYSAVPADFIASTDAVIDTLRMRDAVIQLKDATGAPLTGIRTVHFKQIRSHFGFGAAIKYGDITNNKEKYWDALQTYFEWVTPEHEMKWDFIDQLEDYSDFSEADSIIKWAHERNLKVRGHNLFWNERLEFQPQWTDGLSGPEFKSAMQRRIESAMTHFKGQVEHWDIMNEIIHFQYGIIQERGLYDSLTGDPNIYPWVFQEARKYDPDVKMAVNEYQILTPNSDAIPYTNKIKEFIAGGATIDICGVEGHLSADIDRLGYTQHLNEVAENIDLPIWLTEVDFQDSLGTRADVMEEIMRTAFAHPQVEGLVLWIWWEGRRWREALNSVVVDSQFVETDMGERYRTLREKWTTDTTVMSDENGLVSLKGYHGKYLVSFPAYPDVAPDTMDLEPGADVFTKDLQTSVNYRKPAFSSNEIKFKGRSINLALPTDITSPVYIATYSLSGKLLVKTPLFINNGTGYVPQKVPSGCFIYRIETATEQLLTLKEARLR